MTSGGVKTVKTTCPYCGVGCGVLATKNTDGSVSVKGDPDHPANFGRLCSKGTALGDTVGLEGRLLYPQVQGKKTDWDTVLDLVADKFSKTIKEHGPDSVAFYVSGQILTEDYYIANKLMKGFIGSANIDTNSRLCMASSVAGHRKAFGTDTVPGVYEDLELADVVILVGSNLAWCHPVLYQRIEAAKQSRPNMKVVLVDPRRTMTANLADLHLAIKPDGDTALFNGLLTFLSQKGILKCDYIEKYTSGFEETLLSAASISEQGLIEQTGLSSGELQTFYNLFASNEKVVTVYSQGVNQSVSGTDKVSSIINCHLATGRIGKPGMGPFSVTGQPNAMGGREVGGLANMLACHMDIENEKHRDLVQEFWQAPAMAEKQGLKAVAMFDAVKAGKIKAIWIMSTNPVDSMPDADSVKEALENCPFVVVSDIVEETDTIQYAHVKLPASAWGEKDGTVTNSERRISRQKSFLNQPGDTKPDWWQMAEVAKRMGFEGSFSYNNVSEVFDEYARLSSFRNHDTRDFDIGGLAGLSQVQYDNLEPVQWPQTQIHSPDQTRFFANGEFYTPDRKARFVAVTANREVVTTDDCPFVLNTGRVRDHWHTMTRTARSQKLSSHMGEPYCEINPTDALKFGLQSASLVEVSNPYGSVILRVLISDRVKTGEVFAPMHWTDVFASKARIDVLVPAKLDPFSGQPALKNVAVELKPITPSRYAFLVSRNKPDFKGLNTLYWATAKCEEGWRTELAFASTDDKDSFTSFCLNNEFVTGHLEYEDDLLSASRIVGFDHDQISFAFYSSPKPVSLSREWLVSTLQGKYETALDKQRVLAGRAGAGMPDKGPIICACMSVGANEILDAIQSGYTSVQTIGNVTTAGTNCGSCRAEIKGIIDGYLQQTKIAAE
jgi:assimilatory nitrate reductase catalytic subunit